MQAMFKSELAKLAGVSSRTFRRYLATRRPILTAMGVSPFARKLPPQAVHYISEDYCIDIPPCLKWLMSHFNNKHSSRVPRYPNPRKVVGFCDFEFAFPFEGGLGGSATLLVRFLGASEKMNKFLRFNLKNKIKKNFFLSKRSERDKTLSKCCTFVPGKRARPVVALPAKNHMEPSLLGSIEII